MNEGLGLLQIKKKSIHRSCPDFVFIVEVINNCREKKFPREEYKVGFHCQPRRSRHKCAGKRSYSAGLQGRGPGHPFPLVHMDVKIQVLMHRIGKKGDTGRRSCGQRGIYSLQYLAAYHKPRTWKLMNRPESTIRKNQS